MRCYQYGFEEASSATSTPKGLTASFQRNTAVPRKDPSLNGGLACLYQSIAGATAFNTIALSSLDGGVARTSCYARFPCRFQGIAAWGQITLDKSGTGNLAYALFNTTSRCWDFYVAGVLRISGITVINTGQWHRVEFYFQAAAAGTTNVTLRVDDVTQGSTTVATNTVAATFDRFYLGGNDEFWDDLAINDTWTVVAYDGGNGMLPTAGDVLTSGGKTATIKGQVGDGTRGYILITGGAGGAFADNDALTEPPGAFTGNANGAERTNNTSWCGDGYIVWVYPAADGATSGLTNSAGNSVANWSYVDDDETTTDYVQGIVDNVYDTYTMGNLPSSALSVNSVAAVGYVVKQSAAVSNSAPMTRQGGVDVEWWKQPLPTSYAWKYWQLIQDPTLVPWTVALVNSIEAGVKVKT